MLRPMNPSFSASSSSSSSAAAASSSASAPRRPVYPSGHDSDNEISVASSSLDDEESSSSGHDASGHTRATSSNARTGSGARTTNMSFLARLTGRQRPERDARRFVQSTMDGVFSNLSAKPRVEKPYEEELPPVSVLVPSAAVPL